MCHSDHLGVWRQCASHPYDLKAVCLSLSPIRFEGRVPVVTHMYSVQCSTVIWPVPTNIANQCPSSSYHHNISNILFQWQKSAKSASCVYVTNTTFGILKQSFVLLGRYPDVQQTFSLLAFTWLMFQEFQCHCNRSVLYLESGILTSTQTAAVMEFKYWILLFGFSLAPFWYSGTFIYLQRYIFDEKLNTKYNIKISQFTTFWIVITTLVRGELWLILADNFNSWALV